MRVGVRELRDHLSAYLARARDGQELVVTDRGKAIARLLPMDSEPVLDRLVAEGLVEPAPAPTRGRPRRRVPARGSVSDLVTEQRR